MRAFLRVYDRLLLEWDFIQHCVFFKKQKLRKLAGRSKNEACDLESGVYAWEISAQVSSFPWKQHEILFSQASHIWGIFFVQTTIWKEPSRNPHQDLLAQRRTVWRCKMKIFSSKLDSSFQPPQMALNAYSASVSHLKCIVFFFRRHVLPFGIRAFWVHLGKKIV